MRHASNRTHRLPSFNPFPLASNTRLAATAMIVAACCVAGCAQPERVVVRERIVERPVPPPQQVRVMPPPVREDRGPAPGPGYNWVPGHWRWAGNDWAWTQGHWVQQAVAPMPPVVVEQITVAPTPRAFWVPGHWTWRAEAGGWFWVRGAWHG